MIKNYAGSVEIGTISDPNHCDVESPTDILGQLAFGQVDRSGMKNSALPLWSFYKGRLEINRERWKGRGWLQVLRV